MDNETIDEAELQEDEESTIMIDDPHAEPGAFVTLQFGLDEATQLLDVRIAQIPMDLRIIKQFQSQLGDKMAENNMKLVIFNGFAYLAPIKTSSLILAK